MTVITNIPHCRFCHDAINQNGSVVSMATNPQEFPTDIKKNDVLPIIPMYHWEKVSSLIILSPGRNLRE